ncbi:MAG TPA: lactate racemase domain-containing protein [Aggregatilineales bacterium]|nr:DUF2088 domain-containing protein [Anaerolineales bacterium]HRE47095.1 lactate racemase domain-containing protein [Aggregatilineales bacterium]
MYATLTADQINAIVHATLDPLPLDGRRILVLIPDGTRSGDIPLLFRLISAALLPRVAALDYLIALGTHQPLTPEQISRLVGAIPGEGDYANVRVLNHDWMYVETFAHLGTIPSSEIAALSGGLLTETVEVRVNRLVTEYDHLLVCGAVFPHEVAGFSGGNKYFFPGVGGAEVINLSHWLGALITSYAIIGTVGITPVRALINRAAAFIPTPKTCLAMVVQPGGNDLVGLFGGTMDEAWAQAAALSADIHVRYVPRPFQQVISVMPTMYDDIWTAAKGMYKVEPIVAEGGEVVIYAPHITEFSYTHGRLLAEIGYHVRDYFVKQWERFKGYPGGVLAHSTHLRGIGTYDPAAGEQPRIRVTLATGISAERCAAHNLGYRNPESVDLAALRGREEDGILVVPKAGEMLYRLER